GLSGGSTGTRNMPHLGNTCILGMGQPGTGTAGGCDGHSIVCVGGTEDGKVLTAATCVAGGGAAAAHTGSFVNDSTASKISIILPSSQGDVCQTGRMNSTFAGGTGHPGRPYLICTPNQFNGIDDDVTLVTKAFEIVSDLNFDLATNSNCAAYGIAVNTNPIGGALDSADPTCQTYVTQQDFTGSLDGRNNNINFARFRNGGLSGSGLLISNIGTGGVVKNINLTNSEIGISHTGGLIAGDCFGGTIDTIVVDESMVELEEDGGGVANAGGIVGTTTNCAMSNLYLYGVDVEGRGSYVGGVVGNAVGSYIAGVDFFGGVNSRPDNGGDATFIGGIAGKSQTNISGAVVQGGVSGSLKVGGIAGEGTTASHVIDDSYVLAHISSDKMVNDDATKLFIGGIIGNSSNGTITKTMFMGSISHQCQHTTSANCGVAKFSGSKVGTGLGGINENYTQSEYTSINGLAADIGHHGVEITYAAFRDSSHTGGFSTYDFTVSGRWSHVNGDVPRFKRHNWECELPANLDTVANQVTAGRGGTLSNAIQLCNVNQFKEIKVNSDKIYKVADNFSLFGISDTDLTTSFSGQLWGDDKVLFGGEITGTQSQLGLFRAIAASGKVIDLNLAGFKNLTTGYNNQAVLAGLNYGLIEDVEIHGGVAKAPLYVGLVASKNMETGVIKNVTVSGLVRGGTFAGGIAGVNLYSNGINSSGIIEKVTSRALIHPYNGSSTIAGGIVGQNQGVVREALMAGRIEDDLATPTYFTQDIGGIAGTNTNDGSTTNGSIINSNFSGYSEIRISATANVGGIAGSNDGPIDKTVVEGRVNYDTPGAIPTSYGAIVGNNNLPSEVTARNYYQRDPFRYYSPNFNYNGGGCTDGAGTTTFSITNFSFSPHSPSSHFLRIDFDDNLLIPVSQYSSLTTVVAIGNFCTEIIASGQIDILEMQPAVTEGTKLAGTAFYDINSYCAGASLGGIYFQCSSAGFDITEEYQGVDGIGTQRVLDYYMAEMNGQTLPAYPMWVLESGNDNPPRLFIENNN
ncbi:MAG: hypothetical protein KC493_07400, partial [Bacteriovoracaceae bacterium]|nr:hypothetical protein [Bacteriovoracaceae bacterium]